MKKIIFFSLEDGWLGGVASVNLALQPALREKGFEVKNLFLRGCRFGCEMQEGDVTLRKKCPWEFIDGGKIKEALEEKRFSDAARLLGKRVWDSLRNRWDFFRAKRYLKREAPDCIVISSYLLLDAVPEALLSRTIHHVHTSFSATMAQKANRETLLRYNGKIGYLWLSRGICDKAREAGFQNSFYCYNPLSRFPKERTEAEKHRLVSFVTRFSGEKRLPLAVSVLRDAFAKTEDPDGWRVEFWGTGPEEEALREAIGSDGRFALMGQTRAPFDVLSRSRLTLNTSEYEGFSISVLEATAAGVPTVSFLFGEAAEEEILHGKTGFLVPMDDRDAFVDAVASVLSDDELCQRLSLGAREHGRSFRAQVIAEEWTKLICRLPLDKKGNS